MHYLGLEMNAGKSGADSPKCQGVFLETFGWLNCAK